MAFRKTAALQYMPYQVYCARDGNVRRHTMTHFMKRLDVYDPFEIKRNMDDKPLRWHPETGEPIRRVVLGGFDVLGSRAPVDSSGAGGCCGG